MDEELRRDWDERYRERGIPDGEETSPPPLFEPCAELFPQSGFALDVACGRGRIAAWLANRGMEVFGIDASPVAIELANTYVKRLGLSKRCSFEVHDLDRGLPESQPADLVVCHLFREADLDQQMIERLIPGGTLAVACLSEVGHGPGRFRARPGELSEAFASLEVQEHGEADGHAWLIGRKL